MAANPIPEAVCALARELLADAYSIEPQDVSGGEVNLVMEVASALTAAQQQGQADDEAAAYEQAHRAGESHGRIIAALEQPMQQGGGEVTAEDLRWCNDIADALQEAGGPTNNMRLVALNRLLRHARTAPPSAPVGVEGLVAKWRGLANEALRRSGTWNGNDVADRIEFMADELEAALAQQPAAVDEAIRAAVEAEREACAKACDDLAAYYHAGDDDGPNTRRGMACKACASVIRWRGTVSPSFLAKHEAEISERLATQHQEPKP